MEKKQRQYKVAVLGAGSWGLTLADVLNNNSHSVTVWEYDPRQALALENERVFPPLSGYRVPGEIRITDSLSRAVIDAEIIVVSVPSPAIARVAELLTGCEFPRGAVVISTVKGFEYETLLSPSEVLGKSLGRRVRIAALSGPSHAEEVVRKIPTAVVAASSSKKTRKLVQEVFSNIYFRVYTSSDIKGVEFGGALKNVIAIAAGIAGGMGMGDNTRAALITRSTAEIMRLGESMGASAKTFSGLSGIGDLIVTCFSEHSRNFRFGRFIGEGLSFEEALSRMDTTVEGVNTAKCVRRLAEKFGVQMPLCFKVCEMLFEGKHPGEAWKELMLRPLKSEDDDTQE